MSTAIKNRTVSYLEKNIFSDEDAIPTILAKLYAYYIAADENQINTRSTKSLKYITVRYSRDPTTAVELIKDDLEDIYKDYFDSVSVSVTFTEDIKYTIKIDVVAYRDGVRGVLSRVFYLGGGFINDMIADIHAKTGSRT